MTGSKIKLGLVLLSPAAHPAPSTRVAALNLLPWLRREGWSVEILFEPPVAIEQPQISLSARDIAARGFQVVVFQKCHGDSVVALARALEAMNVRTLYLVCDLVKPEMTAATSATVVVTDFLRSLHPLPLQRKVHVVHDGIERPDVGKRSVDKHRGSPDRPLRAVLVTSAPLDCLPVLVAPPPWLTVTVVGNYVPARERRQRLSSTMWQLRQQKSIGSKLSFLRFVAHPRLRRHAWDADDVYRQLEDADIGILPINRHPVALTGSPTPAWQVKSENRLTLKMAIGLPVVATPIPSYLPVIRQGIDGFLAESRSEWLDQLEALRDPSLRMAMGAAAREAVLSRYSIERQADLLIDVLRRVLTEHR